MATYIVLLGPPGAGKGTQAAAIAKTYQLTHISTGDLFRENIRNKTELGQEVQKYLDKGALVPDSVTIAMVKDRLTQDDCANGALLDGFPRTIAQAEALDEMLEKTFNSKICVVPCIRLPKEKLVERISGRRMCSNGHVFHVVFNPPEKEAVCDTCGEPLYQRKDDNEDTVKTRIDAYEQQTMPLINYYENKGILSYVDGEQSIEAVTVDMKALLDKTINRL